MSVAPVQSTQNVKDQVSAAEWQTRVGGALAWPAPLRKLDKLDSGYRL